jgi:predicted nucleotidyltransferase
MLASKIVGQLPAGVEEVLLTGSVSRGVADADSDLELLLVGAELPLVEEITGTFDVFDVGEMPEREGWWIGATAEGEYLELIAWTRARTEARLNGILAAEIVDHARIRTAEAVAHGAALRTAGRISEWQRQLSDYPEPLVEAIVLDAIGDWTEQTPRAIRALLRPGGRLGLVMRLVEDLENVLRIVFALNRSWEPDWKRLPDLVALLAVKPDRLADRIDEALAQSDILAARTLVRDVLELAPDLPRVLQARSLTQAVLSEFD